MKKLLFPFFKHPAPFLSAKLQTSQHERYGFSTGYCSNIGHQPDM